MNSLFAALGSNNGVKKLQACLQAAPQETLVYGLSNSQKHAIMAAAWQQAPQPMVILVHSSEAVSDWRENLLSLLPGTEVLELPEMDMMTVQAQARSMERAARRMDVLVRLMRKEPVIVLAKTAAAVQKGISRQDFNRLSISISMGEEIALEKLRQRLVQLGYEHADEVERIGQFSARGGIVDIYPVNGENPVRIEFFGDEVDSLREFDINTKRSLKNINSATIMPLAQTDSTGQAEVFLSYLEGKGTVIFDEPTRLREQMRTMVRENPDIKHKVFSWDAIQTAARENRVLYSAMLLQQVHGAEAAQTISFTAPSVATFHRQMDLLMNEISRWLAQKQQVLILLSEKSKADSLRELLARHRYPSLVVEAEAELRTDCVNIQVGSLINGFELAAASLVVVTERDIFGHAKRRAIRKESKGEKLSHFRDIKPGDYVVADTAKGLDLGEVVIGIREVEEQRMTLIQNQMNSSSSIELA